ncbi:MAG: hypothetical protein ABI390_11035, partial [Daejeonella sp.]
MKNLKINLSLVLGLTILFSCKKDKIQEPVPDTPQKTEVISGTITSDITLDPQTAYTLEGKVFVKSNATLTIPAGVNIKVQNATDISAMSALIITKGSKLVVNGTENAPVIFTSAAASKAPGDWIGIIILGNAPTNHADAHVKGLVESADTEFGGTNADDNSGSLNYLRIEYAGGLNPVNEEEWELDMASGLSLEGVGSATTLNHVLVSDSRDDGFQFVGGTVNGKYLIAYNNGDDNFDFDHGYTGKLQFLISYRTTNSPYAIRANGMESLNDKEASGAMPFTRPVISNLTDIGPEALETDLTNQSQGIYIRRNTRFLIRNSVIGGYSNGGLMMCSKTKPILLADAGSEFKFNLVNADITERTFVYDADATGTNIIPDPEVAKYATEMTAAEIEKPAVNKNIIVLSMDQFGLKSA